MLVRETDGEEISNIDKDLDQNGDDGNKDSDRGESSTNRATTSVPRAKAKRNMEPKTGIHLELPPISDITDIYDDLVRKALNLDAAAVLTNVLPKLEITVATMCSGTDAPLMALNMICRGKFSSTIPSMGFPNLA